MSTDLERVLRDGMERFTAALEMPTALARKAYQHRQKRRRAILMLAAAGTATIIGGTVALVAGGPGTSRPWTPAPGKPPGGVLTAAYVLDRAAFAAASSRQPVPKPGQYIFVSSVGTALAISVRPSPQVSPAWLTTERRWIWQSADGRKAGLLHDQLVRLEKLPWGPTPPPYPGRRAEWITLPAQLSCPSARQLTCHPTARGTYEFLTTLPTDPAHLRAWIYSHLDGEQPASEQAWTDIGDMLREMLVPPKLAAALFRVAATIPGATVVPHAADAGGRPGIAVARNIFEDKADAELIFDQHTYQFLGEREVLTSPVKGEGPAGTVVEAYAQFQATVVDHLPTNAPTGQGTTG